MGERRGSMCITLGALHPFFPLHYLLKCHLPYEQSLRDCYIQYLHCSRALLPGMLCQPILCCFDQASTRTFLRVSSFIEPIDFRSVRSEGEKMGLAMKHERLDREVVYIRAV